MWFSKHSCQAVNVKHKLCMDNSMVHIHILGRMSNAMLQISPANSNLYALWLLLNGTSQLLVQYTSACGRFTVGAMIMTSDLDMVN